MRDDTGSAVKEAAAAAFRPQLRRGRRCVEGHSPLFEKSGQGTLRIVQNDERRHALGIEALDEFDGRDMTAADFLAREWKARNDRSRTHDDVPEPRRRTAEHRGGVRSLPSYAELRHRTSPFTGQEKQRRRRSRGPECRGSKRRTASSSGCIIRPGPLSEAAMVEHPALAPPPRNRSNTNRRTQRRPRRPWLSACSPSVPSADRYRQRCVARHPAASAASGGLPADPRSPPRYRRNRAGPRAGRCRY